jgi:hypothetical protein
VGEEGHDMTDQGHDPLAPEELLRVMDAVQVIRDRHDELDRHETFDRDAAVREIQVMFEGLGELVDEDVISKALDDYLAERYSFAPPARGWRTALARLYIRRGVLTRRVLVPAGAVALIAWLGLTVIDAARQRSLEALLRSLAVDAEALVEEHAVHSATIERLRGSAVVAELPDAEVAAFADELAAAERALAGVQGVLEMRLVPESWPGQPDLDARRAIRSDLELARGGISDALAEIAAAQTRLVAQERLESLGREAVALAPAIVEVAEDEGPRSLAAELRQTAERAGALRDPDALAEAVSRMRGLLELLEQEYEVIVTGGVWRRHDTNPDVRNYYLIVRAIDAEGQPVSLSIRNEETGRTEVVSEWAERVPQDVYDRVAADKQDNEIIDDDHFARKRRGYVDPERRYPDVGQITRW